MHTDYLESSFLGSREAARPWKNDYFNTNKEIF